MGWVEKGRDKERKGRGKEKREGGGNVNKITALLQCKAICALESSETLTKSEMVLAKGLKNLELWGRRIARGRTRLRQHFLPPVALGLWQ